MYIIYLHISGILADSIILYDSYLQLLSTNSAIDNKIYKLIFIIFNKLYT